MSRSQRRQQTSPLAAASLASPVSTEDSPLQRELQKIQALLDAGSPSEAFHLATRTVSLDPPRVNARAICLLHLGRAEEAVRAYRTIALESSGFMLREKLPLTYKINFAVALALSGNALGTNNTLKEIGKVHDDRIAALREDLAAWRRNLSFLERLQWKLGAAVDRPVPVRSLPDVVTP